MPKMLPRAMAEYKSDLGLDFENIRFKIRDGFGDCVTYQAPAVTTCSQSTLFKPRAIIATFGPDAAAARQGAKIRFPVPDLADLPEIINDLRECGAECQDLDGESWAVVPPSIGQYSPGFAKITLPVGTFADKRSGRATYTSDALGAGQLVNVAYEIAPTQLSTVIDGCVGTLVDEKICLITGIRTRHAIARGNVEPTAGAPTPTFARKAPIVDPTKIVDCISALGNLNFVQCVGYKGESIARVDLLFPAAAPTP